MAANGIYIVTVTDHLGCSAIASVTVSINPVPIITAQNNGPMCAGAAVVLGSTPSGGTPGYIFLWTGPDFFSATSEDPGSFTSTTASAGVYQVKVTDSKGCSATANTTLVVNPKPTITATNNGPLCVGANLNLQSAPAGGSGIYGFNWTGPAAFSSILEDPASFPVTLSNAGTYQVTLTDNTGCSATTSTILSISNNNAPSITATSNSPVCAGHPLTLSSTPAAGTPPYTGFSWSGPNNYTSSQEDPTAFIAQPSSGGIYTVTVTDNKNCKGTASMTVIVNGPSVTPSSNSPICPLQTLELHAAFTGQSYQWSGPNNFSSTLSDPTILSATVAAAGTYSVTVTDANGCMGVGIVYGSSGR